MVKKLFEKRFHMQKISRFLILICSLALNQVALASTAERENNEAAYRFIPPQQKAWQVSVAIPFSGETRIEAALCRQHNVGGIFRACDMVDIGTITREVGLTMERRGGFRFLIPEQTPFDVHDCIVSTFLPDSGTLLSDSADSSPFGLLEGDVFAQTPERPVIGHYRYTSVMSSDEIRQALLQARLQLEHDMWASISQANSSLMHLVTIALSGDSLEKHPEINGQNCLGIALMIAGGVKDVHLKVKQNLDVSDYEVHIHGHPFTISPNDSTAVLVSTIRGMLVAANLSLDTERRLLTPGSLAPAATSSMAIASSSKVAAAN